MATYVKRLKDDELMHYGVKGMKWKKRLKNRFNELNDLGKKGEEKAYAVYSARMNIEHERRYKAKRKNGIPPKTSVGTIKNNIEDLRSIGEWQKAKDKYNQMRAKNAANIVKSVLKKKKKKKKTPKVSSEYQRELNYNSKKNNF